MYYEIYTEARCFQYRVAVAKSREAAQAYCVKHELYEPWIEEATSVFEEAKCFLEKRPDGVWESLDSWDEWSRDWDGWFGG